MLTFFVHIDHSDQRFSCANFHSIETANELDKSELNLRFELLYNFILNIIGQIQRMVSNSLKVTNRIQKDYTR